MKANNKMVKNTIDFFELMNEYKYSLKSLLIITRA